MEKLSALPDGSSPDATAGVAEHAAGREQLACGFECGQARLRGSRYNVVMWSAWSDERARAGKPLGLLERYEVRSRIASGGMASVWRAYDLRLDREVAIKVLGRRFAGNDPAIRRFKREARTAASLSAHPHVIGIFDVAEEAGRPYIVMQYLAGGTVADAIRAGAVGRDQALGWLAEAAAALDYAHGRGVVHRDVKPGNLLLGLDWRVSVGDFGIARVAGEDTLTRTDQVLGTAAYLSPEQALGEPASEASDRYALAVTAFELLVGQRPFAAEHPIVLARQHVEDAPPPASARNRTLPRAVDAVLARGMAKRPEDRFSTAGAFVDALSAALSPPRRTRHPRRVPTAAQRSRRAVAIAALGAVGVAAGIVVAMPRDGTARHPATPTTQARVSPSAPHRVHHPRATRKPRPAPPALTGTGRATGVLSTAAAPGTTPTVARPPTRTVSPTTRIAAAPTTSVSAAGASTASTTRAAPAPASAAGLEARGHQLMLAGAYTAAIPILQQAIAAASHRDLTYAYALYDLGRSLRLAGDPQAATPILKRRLRIPNQTPIVRHELRLAQHARPSHDPGERTAHDHRRHR